MFEYFFRRYKQDVYGGFISKAKVKHVPWYEWVLLISTVPLLLGMLVCAALKKGSTNFYLMLITLFVMILFLIVDSRTLKKAADDLFTEHKERLDRLRNLLQNNDFQFYNEKQIDWLITVCNDEIGPEKGSLSNFSDYFSKFVFPLITLLFGAILTNSSVEAGIELVLMFSMLLLMIYPISRMIRLISNVIMNPDRDILIILKKNLEYLKTEL